MTNEFVFGYTYIGFPNVFSGSEEGRSRDGGLQLPGPVTRTACRRSRRLARWGHAEAALGLQPRRVRSWRRQLSGLTPTSTCPASATRSRRCGARTPSRLASSGSGSGTPSRPTTTPTAYCGGDRTNAYTYGNAYADLVTGNISDHYNETIVQSASTTLLTTRTRASCRIPGR